jgi:hypothetical protein
VLGIAQSEPVIARFWTEYKCKGRPSARAWHVAMVRTGMNASVKCRNISSDKIPLCAGQNAVLAS